MQQPFVLAVFTVVLRKRARLSSAMHFSYRIKSNILAEHCALRTAHSKRISSIMPPSRTSVSKGMPRLPSAPQICIRISDEALPPNTGRSWHKTTLAPLRATEIAAHTPAIPPPATSTSVLILCFVITLIIYLLRNYSIYKFNQQKNMLTIFSILETPVHIYCGFQWHLLLEPN